MHLTGDCEKPRSNSGRHSSNKCNVETPNLSDLFDNVRGAVQSLAGNPPICTTVGGRFENSSIGCMTYSHLHIYTMHESPFVINLKAALL
jgi:hypothetical protein